MATTISQFNPIICVPGVQPVTDSTNFATQHYTFSQNIRYQNGKPQKIGGWQQQTFDMGVTINGKVRSIYSTQYNNRIQTMIGTNTKLYGVSGSTLTNVTPLDTTSIAAANSLATLYGTLANNPITTTL